MINQNKLFDTAPVNYPKYALALVNIKGLGVKTFSYLIPDEMKDKIKIGQAILVPFGRQGLINAFCVGFSDYLPEEIKAKKINKILDETPLFSIDYLKLLEWVANYYCCDLVTVLNTAIPMKLIEKASKTEQAVEFVKFDGATKRQLAVLELLQKTGKTPLITFERLAKTTRTTIKKLEAAGCLKITEEEIYQNFADDIHQLGEANEMDEAEAARMLKRWYDGYHFAAQSPDIYNPFSLLNTFSKMRFGSYWFETGTPTFLIELLRQGNFNLYELTREQVSEDMLGEIDNRGGNPLPILYQSGYLTIKGYDREFDLYALGFPNREVEEGFGRHLLTGYASVPSGNTAFQIQKFVQEVRRGDIDGFMARLQSFFADIPYELARDLELHYQNVLFIVFKLLGFYVQVEYHTSRGRIDLVMQTRQYIYVMEFKLEGTAEEALRQMEDKQYARPFEVDGRKVFKVGVNFSNEARNIEKWLVKE